MPMHNLLKYSGNYSMHQEVCGIIMMLMSIAMLQIVNHLSIKQK